MRRSASWPQAGHRQIDELDGLAGEELQESEEARRNYVEQLMQDMEDADTASTASGGMDLFEEAASVSCISVDISESGTK